MINYSEKEKILDEIIKLNESLHVEIEKALNENTETENKMGSTIRLISKEEKELLVMVNKGKIIEEEKSKIEKIKNENKTVIEDGKKLLNHFKNRKIGLDNLKKELDKELTYNGQPAFEYLKKIIQDINSNIDVDNKEKEYLKVIDHFKVAFDLQLSEFNALNSTSEEILPIVNAFKVHLEYLRLDIKEGESELEKEAKNEKKFSNIRKGLNDKDEFELKEINNIIRDFLELIYDKKGEPKYDERTIEMFHAFINNDLGDEKSNQYIKNNLKKDPDFGRKKYFFGTNEELKIKLRFRIIFIWGKKIYIERVDDNNNEIDKPVNKMANNLIAEIDRECINVSNKIDEEIKMSGESPNALSLIKEKYVTQGIISEKELEKRVNKITGKDKVSEWQNLLSVKNNIEFFRKKEKEGIYTNTLTRFEMLYEDILKNISNESLCKKLIYIYVHSYRNLFWTCEKDEEVKYKEGYWEKMWELFWEEAKEKIPRPIIQDYSKRMINDFDLKIPELINDIYNKLKSEHSVVNEISKRKNLDELKEMNKGVNSVGNKEQILEGNFNHTPSQIFDKKEGEENRVPPKRKFMRYTNEPQSDSLISEEVISDIEVLNKTHGGSTNEIYVKKFKQLFENCEKVELIDIQIYSGEDGIIVRNGEAGNFMLKKVDNETYLLYPHPKVQTYKTHFVLFEGIERDGSVESNRFKEYSELIEPAIFAPYIPKNKNLKHFNCWKLVKKGKVKQNELRWR